LHCHERNCIRVNRSQLKIIFLPQYSTIQTGGEERDMVVGFTKGRKKFSLFCHVHKLQNVSLSRK
jgi:hypothetical protein